MLQTHKDLGFTSTREFVSETFLLLFYASNKKRMKNERRKIFEWLRLRGQDLFKQAAEVVRETNGEAQQVLKRSTSCEPESPQQMLHGVPEADFSCLGLRTLVLCFLISYCDAVTEMAHEDKHLPEWTSSLEFISAFKRALEHRSISRVRNHWKIMLTCLRRTLDETQRKWSAPYTTEVYLTRSNVQRWLEANVFNVQPGSEEIPVILEEN